MYDPQEEFAIKVLQGMAVYLYQTKQTIEAEGGIATVDEVITRLNDYIQKYDRNI